MAIWIVWSREVIRSPPCLLFTTHTLVKTYIEIGRCRRQLCCAVLLLFSLWFCYFACFFFGCYSCCCFFSWLDQNINNNSQYSREPARAQFNQIHKPNESSSGIKKIDYNISGIQKYSVWKKKYQNIEWQSEAKQNVEWAKVRSKYM